MVHQPFKIIVAEDDEDDLELIQEVLEESGLFDQMDFVKNGEALINFLNDNRENLPTVIITDLNMPVKNGYEVLTDVATSPIFSSIPIIVYTTSINPDCVSKCIELGASDVIIKPFDYADFKELPEKIIKILNSISVH